MLLACVLAAIVYRGDDAAAQGTLLRPNGKIVFVSKRDGNFEIYSMKPDGSGVKRLTNNAADDTEPNWSPDGTHIAFTSNRDGDKEIYVMDADGGNQKRLTFRVGFDLSWNFQPAWSPDGSKIAFVKDPNVRGTSPGIFVMNADGSNPQRLTDNASLNDMPAWSPDGTKIVFRSNRLGSRSDIFVMNADGSAPVRLPTQSLSIVEHPSFSPGGRSIVFNGHPVDGQGGIYIFYYDIPNSLSKVVGTTSLDSQPAWAPDGEHLVFLRYGSGNGDLVMKRVDGSEPTPLAASPDFDGLPDWQRLSPGGTTKIAFRSNRDGNQEIYTMLPDGGSQTNVTNSGVSEKMHVWSPDGTKIAFLRENDNNLYIMNADGTGVAKVTSDDLQHMHLTNLSWSPDGKRIAFISGGDFVHYLSVIDADGKNKRRLDENNSPYLDVVWSPDATKIAFSVGRNFNHSNLYVMNTDASGRTKLTHDEESNVYNRSPAWSPDSRYLAFESNRDGNDEIYILSLWLSTGNTVASGTFRLTTNPASDVDPVWSPDGEQIAFASNRDGNFDIYKTTWYNASNPQKLTNSPADDTDPEWQPNGDPYSPTPDTVQFSTASYRTFEDAAGNSSSSGGALVEIVVTRLGSRTGATSVFYQTSDGTASQRNDYTASSGRLDFADGQATAKFTVPITYDSFIEGNETVNILLTHTGGSEIFGSQRATQLVISDFYTTAPPPNAIDLTDNFVRQHYHDFLNREPDAAGLQFWSNQIAACASDAACIRRKRIDVSGAFFMSIEFQETGFFVYRLSVASFGTLPRYDEFLRDAQMVGQGIVVGQGDWHQRLQQNKERLLSEWVRRALFTALCGGSRPSGEYVDLLLANTRLNVTTEYRNGLVADLDAGRKTQADVLREIVENQTFKRQELNRAFVLMQYFGYLRRNPDDLPDTDMRGYNFWLGKLDQFNGDYRAAEMVKAFITSGEYRQRFGN
jgi:Tol biopolymer transport system component